MSNATGPRDRRSARKNPARDPDASRPTQPPSYDRVARSAYLAHSDLSRPEGDPFVPVPDDGSVPRRSPLSRVDRPRLVARLGESLRRPVTLVSAPAGYGKSTLVAEWLDRVGVAAAWVRLGVWDREPGRLLAHLVDALRSLDRTSMRRAGRMLGSDPPPPAATTLALLNDLADIEGPAVLVLDGLEHLHDAEALDLLRPLLRYPPPAVRLVLIGRSDPFLPLGGLRASGRLVEIRTEDLRFTEEEALTLLREAWGPEVTPELARSWTVATEGWITGIRLALDARAPADAGAPDSYPMTREVRSYLDHEILRDATGPVRTFLMDASVPRAFCGPLLTALASEAGADGGFEGERGGALGWMQSRGMFLVSLDGEGRWWALHSLVRRHLLQHMENERGRREVLRKRARVAGWLAEHGYSDALAWERTAATTRTSRTSAGRPSDGIPTRATGADLVEPLTRREQETLELLGRGLYYREIAESAFVSTETVKSHLKRVYRKLQVSNRRDAVRRARSLGLLDGPLEAQSKERSA